MFKKHNLFALCIAILALFLASLYNEINLSQIIRYENSSDYLRENQTIRTSDDPSYLTPAVNYKEIGIWKDNSEGKQSYFLRPPGLGIIYYAFLSISENNALLLFKVFSLLLFALSVFCLVKCFYFMGISPKLSLIFSLVYTLTPFFSGFLYYTLTESITPQLVLFYIFFLLRAHNANKFSSKYIYYSIAAAIMGFIFITRPVLGILGIAMVFSVVIDYLKMQNKNLLIKTLLLSAILSLSPMILWQVRNYQIAGKFVGLHPVYYPEHNTEFRPAHKAMWNLFESWGTKSDEFHSVIVPFWEVNINGKNDSLELKNILKSIPENAIEKIGEYKFIKAFEKYRESIIFQKYYYDKSLPMPSEIPIIEQGAIESINEITKEYRKKFLIQYLFVAPLKVFKNMVFHSNLSMYMFQHSLRGIWFVESLRLFCLGLNISLYIAVFWGFFLKRNLLLKCFFSVIPFVYIFYLIFFQRGIEERYMLPLLPLMFLGLALTFLTSPMRHPKTTTKNCNYSARRLAMSIICHKGTKTQRCTKKNFYHYLPKKKEQVN